MRMHVASVVALILVVALIKGSSIVAETIDLGTASVTGGFAFAAAGPAVSGPTCDPGHLSRNEVADHAGERLRHLIGKRHHAS